MKKIVLAACLAAFALVTGSVMAQPQSNTPGSAEEQMNKSTGTKGAATKEEKAAARAKRKADAKAMKKPSGNSDEARNRSPNTKAASKEEKAAAKSARKAEGTSMAKPTPGAADAAADGAGPKK